MRIFFVNIFIFGLFCVNASAHLIHRYSFSGNLDDSIGGAHGILVNNSASAYFTDGTLELGNTSLPNSNSTAINYVDLPNGLFSAISSAVTIEAWITWHGPSNSSWQRIFDFGISSSGENVSSGASSSSYCYLTPYSGSGTCRFGYRSDALFGTSAERVIDSNTLPVDTQVYVAIVWDDVSGQVRMYLNGLPVASGLLHYTLSQLRDVNNWLGRSQWPDPAFHGGYNEFRIYDIALSDAMIQASYLSGPDTPAVTYAAPSNPSPAHQADTGDLTPLLSWESDPSSDIVSHRIYLGTNYTEVLKATTASTGIYQGAALPGSETYIPASSLAMDQIYYWRIEEATQSGYYFSGPVWTFHTVNLKAHSPFPGDETQGVSPIGLTLQWHPGEGAVSHRILMGTSPLSLEVLEADWQETFYPVANLNNQTDYHWRIDEQYPSETITGDTWTFKTIQKPAACLMGDLDGNCRVDIQDLALFCGNWLEAVNCSGFDCPDLVQDQLVNIDDLVILTDNWLDVSVPQVVINEIHYHPDNNTEPVEFIELYNAGPMAADLDGWFLEGAVQFTFPSISINPGGCVVVCQDPDALQIKFGVAAYGPFEGNLSNEGERIVLRNAAGSKIDEVEYGSEFPWPVAANGEGASMELIHPSLDNNLGGSWRSSGYNLNTRPELSYGAPTPGWHNSVYADNAPPQIRQVSHVPHQPLSTESITITAKITDPDGVNPAKVYLKYQLVSPGSYIPAYLPIAISSLIANPSQSQPLNPAFEDSVNWITGPMMDNGVPPDTVAGDGVYTYQLSAQANRTLIRYRIEAWDTPGSSVRVPYADDASLNFACFVYDGVPAYTANTATVQTAGAPYTYSAEIMNSLPVYMLITRAADLYQCNGYNASDRIDQAEWPPNENEQAAGRAYNWEGAFVYDGKVYDHIGYRLRGGNGRYNNGRGGKRSMKFRFNRGNYFQAHNLYGDKFPSKWQHLVTGKMLGNHYGFEGFDKYMYGLNEIMDLRLWSISDVPAPEGYWFTFRVIDGANEAPTTTTGQYDGDFWGLYIAFENYDGAFLERLGLPKGNLYKLSDKVYDGLLQLRYQGENAVDDASDYENIRWNLSYNASADFIRNHLDCDEWYRYHTVTEAVRHYDIFSGGYCTHCMKNVAWYFYPDYTPANNYLGKIQFLPFDFDDTWGPYFNQGCDHAKGAIYDQEYLGGLSQKTVQPEKAPLKQEYRNYIREYRDLMWQEEVVYPMISELASVISDIVPADRDRWRLEPGFSDAYRSDPGPLEPIVAGLESFAFQPTSIYAYWPGSSSNLDSLSNAENDLSNIPYTPTISYIGEPNYPENGLLFQTSAFSDPQGNDTFAALKWRIAEYEDLSYSQPITETLISQGSNWFYFKGTQEPSTETGAWRQLLFDDSGWTQGPAPVGYDSSLAMGTPLTDMRNNYSTIYLRKEFDVVNPAEIQSLEISILRDDGFKLWINGQLALEENVPAEENLPYDAVLADYGLSYIPDETVYKNFTISNPADFLAAGTNVIAIQVINVNLGESSDCFADLAMAAILSDPVGQEIRLSKHKYELQPVWESDEITTFAGDIRIPADGVKPGHAYRVRCKMKDTTGRWSHWSAPIEFIAGQAINAAILDYLRLTEMMYNPAQADITKGELNVDNNEFEFIELKNFSSSETLDLQDVSFTTGVTFSFAGKAVTSLAPGEFVLVVKNPAAFNSRYSGLSGRIAGTYGGSLSNSGEAVKLEDTWNGTIAEFEYSDGRGWPMAADGAGHSLIPQTWGIEDQPQDILSYGGNWRPSTYIGGSPGTDDPAPSAGLVINEFAAHTDYSNPAYPDYDSNDWIELYNTGSSPVNVGSNWYLSDDIDNLKKWALPIGSISAGGRVSFDEITGFHSPITTGFGLDKAGEQIYLSYLPGTTGQDRVVDCIKFKGQENGISLGRYPDGGNYWFSMTPSRNAANTPPMENVVISEIMYHPQDGTANDEYIELSNPTNSAINLWTTTGPWALDGGVSFTLPASVTLANDTKIVIVGFDPVIETARLSAFNSAYGSSLVANSTVFGPWSGDLSNAGERVTLEKPQDSDDPLNPSAISWIIVNECIYGDSWPWPTGPDGSGTALNRTSITGSGNDPGSWDQSNPTPGY